MILAETHLESAFRRAAGWQRSLIDSRSVDLDAKLFARRGIRINAHLERCPSAARRTRFGQRFAPQQRHRRGARIIVMGADKLKDTGMVGTAVIQPDARHVLKDEPVAILVSAARRCSREERIALTPA